MKANESEMKAVNSRSAWFDVPQSRSISALNWWWPSPRSVVLSAFACTSSSASLDCLHPTPPLRHMPIYFKLRSSGRSLELSDTFGISPLNIAPM